MDDAAPGTFPVPSHISGFQKAQWSKKSTGPIDVIVDPLDLILVYFTSGSTGQPKGVMLNHRGYVNSLQWYQETFPMAEGERGAQHFACCFDMSFPELWWPLMVGGVVCATPKDVTANPWKLSQWMQKHEIVWMSWVPSHFGEFTAALQELKPAYPKLRGMFFAGETLPAAYIQRWWDHFGGSHVKVINGYGPTETVIATSGHHIRTRPPDNHNLSIGAPWAGVYYISLDPTTLQPVPDGEVGELYIGGQQIARGYLKDPVKTGACFISNPFPEIPSDQLYKTGDLALKLPNGEYEFHGRVDTQVKVRGFRVELGEIEHRLTSHPSVKEAVALAVENNTKIVAWYVSAEVLPERELRKYIGETLPHYMVPNQTIWKLMIPKNGNGKQDRNVLRAEYEQGFHVDEAEPVLSRDISRAPSMAVERLASIAIEQPAQRHTTTIVVGTLDIPESNTRVAVAMEAACSPNAMDLRIQQMSLQKLQEMLAEEVLPPERLSTETCSPPQTLVRITSNSFIRILKEEAEPTSNVAVRDISGLPMAMTEIVEGGALMEMQGRMVLEPVDMALSMEVLSKAVNLLITKHPAFRTRMVDTDGKMESRVLPSVPGFWVRCYDIVASGAEGFEELKSKKGEALNAMRADYWPAFDFFAVRESGNTAWVGLSAHGSVWHNLRGHLVLKELMQLYNALGERNITDRDTDFCRCMSR